MFSLTTHSTKKRLAIFLLALVAGPAALVATPMASAQVGTSRVPRDDYYLAKAALYEGDYREALQGFTRSLKSGVRIGQARWIDSVCYYSMLGEFQFQQGNLVAALEAHEAAIQVHVLNPGWMSRLSYPRIGPSTDRVQLKIRWGQLPTKMAALPDSMSSLEGSFDLQTPFEIGGVVNPAHTRRIDAVEVFRCLAVSLRRRAELLGDTGPVARKTQTITSSFSSLSVPSDHWIGAWIEVLYGLALLSEGQPKEAISHLESGTTSRALHHPLTGIALLERGKYQLKRGEYAKATALLRQATVAAAHYRQSTIVEESFRYLADAFLASEGKTAMPALAPAVLFAESERNWRLAAALRLNSAEVAVYGNDPSSAAGLLTQARTIMARLGLLATDLGARLTYLEAITQYRAGNLAAAGKSIKLAIAQKKQTSLERFHLALIEQLYKAGRKAISPRDAEILFSRALREPTERDWRTNPLETITMLVSSQTGSMERWFELLIDRREYREAVRVAEQLKRHRFYSTLPFGGRILSLRWLVDGDQAMLGKAIQEQKRLRDKYPALADLSRKSEKIRLKLKQDPLVPADEEQAKKQKALIKELRAISNQLESLVREIALRREPTKLVFPPQPSLSAIQRGMNANQAVLMFVTTDQGWHAWFVRRNMDEYWKIGNTKAVRRGIASLLKSLGNRDRNFAISTEDLSKEDWKRPAAGLWKALIGELPRQGWEGLDELVIIPDGVLWYLPFELLQVPADQLVDVDESSTLLSQVRIRYAPVASLSVGDQRGHNPNLKTTIVGGQLFPKESSEYAGEMLTKLKEVLKDVEVIGKKKKPLGASRFTAGTFERLIVWNDIKVALKDPYGWAPAQYDRASNESSLADWMEYPWGGPDQVIAPGFHTAAEGALSKKATGYEVFLTACGLMSTGTRTALLSRWRTGGKAPAIFVREFTRGLTEHSASEAYRTASELVRAETLSPDKEPRLRDSKGDDEVTAEHPFFWSGYLLIDSGAEPTGEEAVEVPPPAQPLADKAEEDNAADRDKVVADEPPKENPLVKALKEAEDNIGDEVSDLLIDPTEAVDTIDE